MPQTGLFILMFDKLNYNIISITRFIVVAVSAVKSELYTRISKSEVMEKEDRSFRLNNGQLLRYENCRIVTTRCCSRAQCRK